MKQIPHFLQVIGKDLANEYSKEILPVLVVLSADRVRLFPEAPTSVGQSLVSIINFYMETESETVFTIVKNLSDSGAVGARYSVGVAFRLFMPFVKAEETRKFFLDLYDSLLKDQKVVQLAAISSLADVIGIVTPEHKQRYLRSFMNFMDDPFWRVRLQIASSFSRVVTSIGESVDVNSYLYKLLNDPMAATRSKAAQVTAQVFLIASPEFRESIRNNFVVLSKKNYHRRQTVVEFIAWVFGSTRSFDDAMQILNKFFIPFFMSCSDDPVANVRMHVCHAIALIHSKYPEFIEYSSIHDLCCNLLADDDEDVASSAKEAFGQFITNSQ